MGAGQPMKYKNLKELVKAMDRYFKSITIDVPRFITVHKGYKKNNKGNDIKSKPIYEDEAVLDNNDEQVVDVKYISNPSILGLCLYLEIDRRTLCNYEKIDDEYFHTIKKYKAKVEAFLEQELYRDKNVTGIIFNLKNNHDWKDKQEVVSVNIDVVDDLTDSLTNEELIELIREKTKELLK